MHFLLKAIILNSLISLSAHADFWDLLRRSPKLPQQAVQDQDVRNASCAKNSFNLLGYTDYSKTFNDLKKGKRKRLSLINGKKFVDQPEGMIELYRDLTNYNNYRMNAYCSDIECEIISLFGETYAHKLTYLLRNYSYNASYLASSKGSMFTERELDGILYAFELFPSFMFDSREKKLIKDSTPQGPFYANVAGYAEDGTGNITLYNKWIQSTSETQVYTIVHEYAHVLGNKLGIDQSKLWVDFSKWNDIDTDEENKHPTLVSEYAKSNYIEDFAESVSAYRLNPKVLKEKAPKKYDFIQNALFLGMDFQSKSCQSALTNATFALSNLDDKALKKKCEMDVTSYKFGFESKDFALGCFRENLSSLKLKSLKNIPSSYSEMIKKNFSKGSYPAVGYELRERYMKQASDALDKE